jgi:hypothetical protein
MKKIFLLILLSVFITATSAYSYPYNGPYTSYTIDAETWEDLYLTDPYVTITSHSETLLTGLTAEIYEYDIYNAVKIGEPLIVFQGRRTGENEYLCEFTLILDQLPGRVAIYISVDSAVESYDIPPIRICTNPTEAVNAFTHLDLLTNKFSPTLLLSYDGNVTVSKQLLVKGQLQVQAEETGHLATFFRTDDGDAEIQIGHATANNEAAVIGFNSADAYYYMSVYGLGNNRLVFNSHGFLGVGFTHPQHLIDTGGAYCNGSSWVNASSRDLKQDFSFLTSAQARDTLAELKPMQFTYKKDPSEKTLGFIAEDVPDLVATNDRKSLNPMDIIAILTKVVQEQQKTVQDQKATIAELSKRLALLENGVKIAKYQD